MKLERIHGVPLSEAIPEIRSNCGRTYAFVSHCLDLLIELQEKGIEHRNIYLPNILVRDQKPVLIDFGWAASEAAPYVAPQGLRNFSPVDGVHCDVYSMGKVFAEINQHRYEWLDAIIELMTQEDVSSRFTDLSMLQLLTAVAASMEMVSQEGETLEPAKGKAIWDIPSGTDLTSVFRALRQLLSQQVRSNRRIGLFRQEVADLARQNKQSDHELLLVASRLDEQQRASSDLKRRIEDLQQENENLTRRKLEDEKARDETARELREMTSAFNELQPLYVQSKLDYELLADEVGRLRGELDTVWLELDALRKTYTVRVSRVLGLAVSCLFRSLRDRA